MTITSSNISINVKDLDKSISFYESIGLTVKNRWGNYYAQLTAPDVVIGLHPSGDANLLGNSGNASIGFTVDDLEGAKSLLQKLSIKTTDRQEEGGQFLHFDDPDGTSLYFIKPNW
ncbi:MAG TPA: VOC family protein [Parafilimonas sp.]|nr:VOC family protein [Parafilimonas sp.]